MTKYEKLYEKIVIRGITKGIGFDDLRYFLERTGFALRKITGDHYLYVMDGLQRPINIQPVGSEAKPYQVKQVKNVIRQLRLGGEVDE